MLEKIGSNTSGLIMIMIFIILLGIVIMIIPIFKRNKKIKDNQNENLGLNDTEIKKIDDTLNKGELIKDIFAIYKKAEVAKSKFDYETLKQLLTEILYKEEEQKLKLLKANKQKLVATNIKLQEIKLLSIKNIDEATFVEAYLYVSEYNYVIDSKKKVIRGTDEAEYQIEYKITLEKNIDKHFKITKLECTGKWIKNN